MLSSYIGEEADKCMGTYRKYVKYSLLNVSVAVEIGERISEIGQIVCKLIRTTFNW